ncbi:SNF2 family N-terminal domain-containing protein [Hypoxylon sp. FL1150]|nr:SNF2 family N-terminal domain-containing protein [Hypoxylon sp. FL1150]
MAPVKRQPVIDLTTDESEPKAPRRQDRSFARSSSQVSAAYDSQSIPPPSSLGHSLQQPPRASWGVDDDDPDQSQDQADPTNLYELYGTSDIKIVGVRYYNGVINPGERVLCRREPSNPYDSNAIRVDNVMQQQIGHIPRNLAAKLAPYLDANQIVLDGILTGHKTAFDCPVRLYFYGPGDTSTRLELEAKLKEDRLLKATQLKATRKEAEAQRNAAKHLDKSSPSVGLTSNYLTSSQGTQQEDLLQDLMAGSEAVQLRGDLDSVDAFAMDEDSLSKLPKAQQPDSIQSTLLPYQLQGLAWMLSKEDPQLPAAGSKEVVQLWKRTAHDNFTNIVSNHITKEPPKLVSGGVLADDMGLGKTLQVISLILTSGFKEGPTLIVSPVGVMSNWEQQIKRHVKEDQLPRVLRYHGTGISKKDLLANDIVITTYDKLRIDNSKKGPLLSVEWHRVVLDEAHAIRNFSTSRAKAAFQVQAKSRWMLTGTPIINSPKDFLSALMFLKITGGIEEPGIFLRIVDKPLSSGRAFQDSTEFKLAKQLFQSLTKDLCLRRRKDMKFVDLKLPPKTEYIHRIKFTDDEQRKYDALLSETTEMLEAYRRRKQSAKGQGNQIRFTSVLEKLLRLRQICNHWSLIGDRVKDVLKPLDGEKLVKFTPENLKILQQALLTATTEGEECPICIEAISVHTPVITACKHRFGKPCITRSLEIKDTCPMCRQKLTLDSLVGLEPVDNDNEEFDGDTRSSKTQALEKILTAKLKDPKSKIIIFSQWTSFLHVIGKLLDDAGLKYCSIEGWMKIAKRDESIEALNNDPDTRIMLASLAASGVGLNLVAADTVILVDSWWAPAIEDQAVDRVHRLGQTRETTVWKLVMDGSIEERVLDIQAKKRELVDLAFQDKVREKKETSRLDDVLQLLS